MIKALKTHEIEKENSEGDYIEFSVLEGGLCLVKHCFGGVEQEIVLTDGNILKMSHLVMMQRMLDENKTGCRHGTPRPEICARCEEERLQ